MSSAGEDEDAKLEEMLRQAAYLEAQMKSSASQRSRSSQEESLQSRQSSIPSERDSLSRSGTSSSGNNCDRKAPAPVDDMLRQAELLSQKMRSSRHQAYAETVLADDPDDSVDDMLRKAEILSMKMSPPRKTRTAAKAVENTPALIRHSERILANMYHNEQQSTADLTTPELMRQTEHLLGKMKASRTKDAGDENRGRSSSGPLLSNPDHLVASMKAEHQPTERSIDSHGSATSNQQSPKSGGHGSNRSQELKHLMEQALSSWTGSPEEKGRVKNALDQIVPSLDSTPHTPSTVSIQAPDEMSSVGSQSPKSSRSAIRTRSLLNTADRPPLPRHSQNANVAVEMARDMAMALEETRSRSSSDVEDFSSQENVVEAVDPGFHNHNKETQLSATPSTGAQSSLPQSPPRSLKRNVAQPSPPMDSQPKATPSNSAESPLPQSPARSVKRSDQPPPLPVESQPKATPSFGAQALLPQSPPRSVKRNIQPPSPPMELQPKVTQSTDRHTSLSQSPPRSMKRTIPPASTPPPRREPSGPVRNKGKRKSSHQSRSFMPGRGPASSEEAQYNAIMSAIDLSGRGPVCWEKVDSPGENDDDYVPLVDYSKKRRKRALGVGSFDVRVMGRSPRGNMLRRKVGRIALACLLLLAVGAAMKFWCFSSGGIDQDTLDDDFEVNIVHDEEPVMVVEDEEDEHCDDHPTFEPLVEKVPEQQSRDRRDYDTDRWVPAESNAVALVPNSPKWRIREQVVSMALRGRKWFLRFVVFLTPPWERFCRGDARACRDTNRLLNSLSSS